MKRRTRIQIAEYGIFAVVALTSLNSAYSLFFSQIRSGANRSIASQAGSNTPGTEATSLAASQRAPVLELESSCEESTKSLKTNAAQVRISGLFCGLLKKRAPASAEASSTGVKPSQIYQELPKDCVIQNVRSGHTSTVFMDRMALKFSSELIPLVKGENEITVNFQYSNRKVPLTLRVTRSE